MSLDMYTAFRGKVTIKDEYKRLVELINDGEWKKAELEFPFVKEYTKIHMSEKIPFAKNQISKELEEDGFIYFRYHHGDWEEDSEYYTDLKGNTWSFIANLQDYKDPKNNNATPISSFMNIVLKRIVNNIIKLEEWYGEKDSPIEYKLTKTGFERKN